MTFAAQHTQHTRAPAEAAAADLHRKADLHRTSKADPIRAKAAEAAALAAAARPTLASVCRDAAGRLFCAAGLLHEGCCCSPSGPNSLRIAGDESWSPILASRARRQGSPSKPAAWMMDPCASAPCVPSGQCPWVTSPMRRRRFCGAQSFEAAPACYGPPSSPPLAAPGWPFAVDECLRPRR